MKQELIDALLSYGNKLLEKDDDKLVKATKDYPTSFVLCCIADKNVKSTIAWEIHNYIKDFSFEQMQSFKIENWEDILLETEYRRPFKLAEEYYNAIKLIKNKYDGKIETLWQESTSFSEVVSKFLEFDGVGIKIANMAAILLKRHFGVNFSDEHFLDVAPDTHVREIFKVLGFIDKNINSSTEKENKRIIYAARALNPSAPYSLDYPAYKIGQDFCHKNKHKKCLECPIMKKLNPDKFPKTANITTS